MGIDLYYWYKEHGICPMCRTNEAEDGKTLCYECLAKQRVRNAKVDKEYYNEYQRKYQRVHKKKQYYERKAQGLCTRCGKAVVTDRTVCKECREKLKTRRLKCQAKE